MELSQWFNTLLQISADGLIWSVEQMPVERRHSAPPRHPDTWPVARQLFHMVYYEETLVLPNMNMWLPGTAALSQNVHEHVETTGARDMDFEERRDQQAQNRSEEQVWADEQGVEHVDRLIERFRAVRASQLVMLPQFDEQAWETPREATWGNVTLRWVVTKTFQHTAEHTNDILKMALFWQ